MFNHVQEEESAQFVLNMLNSPNRLFEHIHQHTSANILHILYIYASGEHGKDALIELADTSTDDLADASTPGKYFVDVFPICKCNYQIIKH